MLIGPAALLAASLVGGPGSGATFTASSANPGSVFASAPPKPDFDLAVSPSSLTAEQGVSTATDVRIAARNGYSSAASLSVTGLPAGTTASFDPASVAGSGDSRLTLNTSASTPPGSYALSVKAVSGSLDHTADVTLRVTEPPLASALPPPLPDSTGTTFYVSSSGSDDNPGTRSEPWRTVQKALDTLDPGERALVREGTYTEDLYFDREGTEDEPITVAAYPGEAVTLRAASTEENTFPVIFNGAYIRFEGFTIEGASGLSSTNVYFDVNAFRVELAGNDIHHSQDQGIYAEDTTGELRIVGNRIHDNGAEHVPGQQQSHGLYIEGENHLIANNAIYDHPFGFGIQLFPGNHGTTVVNNTVVGSGQGGIVLGGWDGVYDIVVRNNIFAFNSGYGVQMDYECPTRSVVVDTNVIFGNRSGAVQRGCSAVDTSGGNVFADPLFVDLAARDLHLRSGSPAIDAARRAWSLASDADERTRPQGAGSDVGAYEDG